MASDQQLDMEAGDRFLRTSLRPLADAVSGYISLIMVDIDDLTIINKHYNEKVGDEVLATVACIIQEMSQEEIGTAYSGRCGDDTFYAVFPNLGIFEAKLIAESLCARIKLHQWDALATNLQVTCAFGVAELRLNEPIEDWVIRASCGFKAAKNSGGNQVAIGPDYLSNTQSRELRHYYSGPE